jgi:hypothetical protein
MGPFSNTARVVFRSTYSASFSPSGITRTASLAMLADRSSRAGRRFTPGFV